MLISIIMPIYNAAPFLKACLDSILSQSFSDWELLAVDDGSQDDSLKILHAYAEKDARIKVQSFPHQGIIHALQKGFERSSGVLISRMDADDRMPEHKLITMHKAWQQHGKGHLITGKVTYFSDLSLGEGYQKYTRWINQLVDQQNHFSQIFRECVIPSCAWLVHREDFLHCGGFQSEIYPEDYDLCFRFYRHNIKVIALSEVLHFWRDHEKRSSRNDPNYLDNRFLDLKLHYFLLLHKNNILLWGAGKKGKYIAQYLLNKNCPFQWMTNNENKIGKEIYGKKLKSSADWEKGYIEVTKNNSSINKYILAIANPQEQLAVRKQLINKNLQEGKDFFFFA